jgi:hypothetical protein
MAPRAIWDMTPEEFMAHIRRTMPAGYTLDEWTTPPDMLAKVSFVRYAGLSERVVIGYFELKMKNPDAQKKLVWDSITDAIERLRVQEAQTCRIR